MRFRRTLLTAAAGFSIASASSAQTKIAVPFTIDTLANGLILIVHEDHSVPVVATNVWYRVGSGDEKPGRTGFAHLFEHLMFMGSEHAPYPAFDRLLEAAGADNNGSTTEDRTNYYEEGPSNALPLMLWLEADRMGFFLPTMDSVKVDLQRDVVKNERRQRVDNQPYGLAYETLARMLYPAGHPYSWPTIGSMTDLSAATLEDTKEFFRKYYAPNNASIVVAGDVRPDEVRTLVRKYFGNIPRGPAITRPVVAPFALSRDTVAVLEDRVQLPRLYYAWHSTRGFVPDDYALQLLGYILTGAKNSRLTQKLVYELELATDVYAAQQGDRLDGYFSVVATARPGHTLPEIHAIVNSEIARLAADGPTARELEQAKNSTEAAFLARLERVGQKADLLNAYAYLTGDPGYFAKELDAIRAVTRDAVQRAARTYLAAPKAILSIVPQGKQDLAVKATTRAP